MVRETDGLPPKAKSYYMCLKCKYVFNISDEYFGELNLIMCPRCGAPTIIKLRPRTRKFVLGV